MVLALGLLAMTMRTVTDPDVWWHLRTGQLILQNHHVPHADPYSFTRAGHPWVNHEWLADVLIYGLYHASGWTGLIVVFGVITAVAFVFAYLLSEGRPYVAGVVTVAAAVASAPAWGVRPQMLSLMLASVFLFVLTTSETRARRLWWTLPLMLIWVNLHAGYALGPFLLVLFIVGDALDASLGFIPWNQTASRLRRLAFALLACLLIVPLNPNGARMYLYPWQTLTSQAMQKYIEEWFSPNFHEAKYLPLMFLILACIVAAALSPKRLRCREYLLLAATLAAALRSVRHIPIFVLVAIPVLSGCIEAWRKMRKPAAARTSTLSLSVPRLVVNAIVLIAFTIFTVSRIHSLVQRQRGNEAHDFPLAAVSFLARQKLPPPILNHYNWGGYLIWQLYPAYPVFIDGRADVYGDAFLNNLAKIYYLRDGWKEALEPWRVRTIVLPPDAPLVTFLRSQAGWAQVYQDSQAVILEKR